MPMEESDYLLSFQGGVVRKIVQLQRGVYEEV